MISVRSWIAEIRYGPDLPAPLKELFDPNYNNETPVSIYGQMLMGYNKQNGQNGNFTHDAGLSLLSGAAQQAVPGGSLH